MKMKPCDFSIIGNRIKQARKAKKITQEQLGELINISPKNVSQLERGMNGLALSTLMKICQALDVSADYILFGIKNDCQKNTVNIMLSELSENQQIYAENLLAVYVEACKNSFQKK